MEFLNKKQLAFILDIKPEEARGKMCVAWCRENQIRNEARTSRNKVIDSYPEAMPISLLAKGLNLPTLQAMVDDIVDNYLVRKTTRKYILYDLPEKKLEACFAAGRNKKSIKIPPALKSMLPSKALEEIKEVWNSKHGIPV